MSTSDSGSPEDPVRRPLSEHDGQVGKSFAPDPNSFVPADRTGSSSAEHRQWMNQAADPPVVVTRTPHDSPDPLHEAMDWIDRVLGTESYGAPRVFDLFTLLAVTLAFALLFALLRMAEPVFPGSLPSVAVAISVFVTGIAIAQMVLFGSKKPRIASLLAGPPVWFAIGVGFNLWSSRQWADPWVYVILLFAAVFLGLPSGYLGGAMVAGVFLLADFFRSKFLKPSANDTQSSNDDQIFS